MRVFVDSNVILDFFLARESHKEAVAELFGQICQEKVEAWTSASAIADIYYVVAKRLGQTRARDVLIDLLGLLGIIAVDGSDCLEALELPIDDFEDALIVTCASKAGIDVIITGDIDFLGVSTPMARVVSVADFLRENGLQWGRG